MEDFTKGFFENKYQELYSGYTLYRFDSFFNKDSEPPKQDSGKNYENTFLSFFDQPKEMQNKTDSLDSDKFKKPQKKKPSDKNQEMLFSLKRDAPNRIFPEIKKQKLDPLQSPLPKKKTNIFSSAQKQVPKSTPYKPTVSNIDDIVIQSKNFEDERKEIEELRRTIDNLEDLKIEDTYAKIKNLIFLHQEIPKLTLEALKVRAAQVELFNKILSTEIPELKEKSSLLCEFKL